ncbi:MAG TPA: hypothetical protein P5084_12550, partial [Paludibacter sp.]|nr:hypothetical protein [Paludibacter sp.]
MYKKLRLLFLLLLVSKTVFAGDTITVDKNIFCFNEDIVVKSTFADTLNYSLNWQYKANANDWVSINTFPGENIDSVMNNQLILSNFNDSITFNIRCLYIKKTGIIDTLQSNLIENLKVLPTITAPKIAPINDTLCYNSPIKLTLLQKATGADNVFTYQWQHKTSAETEFTDFQGATDTTYTDSIKLQTYYRVKAKSACDSVYSDTIKVNVYEKLEPGTIGTDKTYCFGQNPDTLKLTLTNGGSKIYAYQWLESTDNQTFTTIPGANNPSYFPANISDSIYYKVVVNDEKCGLDTTQAVKIKVLKQITAPELSPLSQTYNAVDPTVITISTPATGSDGKFTYQWQKSADKITFTPISEAAGLSHTTGLLTDTTYYRAVATSDFGCGIVISDTATVFVNEQLSAGTIGANQTICNTGTINKLQQITTPTGGNGTYTYLWQESTDSVAFTNIETAITNEYLPLKTTGKKFYRLSVKSDNDSVPTNIISINVLPVLIAPKLSPLSQTYNAVDPTVITISTPATGSDGKFTYQWQKSADKITFTPISEAAGLSHTTGLLTDTTYYRAVATSDFGCGIVISDTATVFVNEQLSAGTIGANQTICNTGTINKLQQITTPTGGNGTYTYLWQESTDSVAFTNIETATTNEYLPVKTTGKKFYRLSVKSDNDSISTNTVTIKVLPVITSPKLSPKIQSIYQNKTATITVSTPAGGSDGKFTYQWQKSADKITFTPISDASGLSYTSGLLTDTIFYRAIATSDFGCGFVIS